MSSSSKAVFLSYASQDATAATHIAKILREADVEVWFDQSELRGGDAWDAKIRQQIKACALFVPLISRHTQQRLEGYFRLEWHLAERRMQQMHEDAAFLLPVVIDETGEENPRVPEKFLDVQWMRFPSGEPTPALAKRVTSLLNPVRTANGSAVAAGAPACRNETKFGGRQGFRLVEPGAEGATASKASSSERRLPLLQTPTTNKSALTMGAAARTHAPKSRATMNPEKVLIVEDDPTMQRVLKDNFEFRGFDVRVAPDGRQALDLVATFQPDLIVLDIMLPGVNGFDVCRKVRQEGLATPIIMLTAKSQESDIVLGLNLGADDYVPKPFSIEVLLARATACLRRSREPQRAMFEFGDCQLDRESHKLFRHGEEVALTPKEFGLLEYFVKNTGRALTREKILDAVWGDDLIVTDRSVDRCINTLRNKVESDPERPRHIRTIRDVGYRFEVG